MLVTCDVLPRELGIPYNEMNIPSLHYHLLNPTIAAIATPIGTGSIGVVRISGQLTRNIVNRIFVTRLGANAGDLPSHTVHLGTIIDPSTGDPIDDGLITIFSAPNSYTGEDSAEISCHGGIVSVRRVLESALKAGAKMAEPGEFTKRAFLNGKLDLIQAEAVNDIILARTEAAQRVAFRQLEGVLSHNIRNMISCLTGIIASIEASIDFPDDVPEPDRESLLEKISSTISQIENLIATSSSGRIYREGAHMVIAGKPNVGKSSLLNALLRDSRAIVTPVPGTTRDVIEEGLEINGIPVVAVDTAGLRDTNDVVERIGIERAQVTLENADLVLYLIDAQIGFSDDDKKYINSYSNKPFILVVNKKDLISESELDCLISNVSRELSPEILICPISAEKGDGIAELEKTISELLATTAIDSPMVTNVRHKRSLEAAAESLKLAADTLSGTEAMDLASGAIMSARNSLGEITGETVTEDILDRIFSEFCIGK